MVSDNSGDETRRYDRIAVPGNYQATLKDQQGREQKVGVTDISAGGAGLVVDGQFGNSSFVELHMDGFGRVPAKVKRQFAEGIGVEFDLNEKEREAMKEELLAFRKSVAAKKF
jgi:hypothetical protein